VRFVFDAITESAAVAPPTEDFYCAEPALGLFAIATASEQDGGWVVARAFLRALRQYVAESRDGSADERLSAGLKVAHDNVSAAVMPHATEPSVTALLFDRRVVGGATSGGCSAYRGSDPVLPGTFTSPAQCGDRWILCSPGLRRALSDQALAHLASQSPSGESRLGDRLVHHAKQTGTSDTLTALVVDVC
jgi:hypothetical protein